LRNTSAENVQNLKDMVMLTDFSIFQDECINTYTEAVTEYLKFCFDICCPITRIFIAPNKISSPHLKYLRRRKEKAYKFHNYDDVKHYSTLIKNEIDLLNKTSSARIFNTGNSKELWTGIKSFTGQSKACPYTNIDINELNLSFIHQSNETLDEYPINSLNATEFGPIQTETVLNLLKKVQRDSSAGADGLAPLILKECAEFISPTLADIYTRSFTLGKIPTSWKSVKITPIPKSGHTSTNIKLRPIASSSIFLKVAERLLLDEISVQLKLSADSYQFAYKSNRSTVDAIATLYHNITSTIDAGSKRFQTIFLDFSSAFNTIDRKKILEKLEALGASQWSLSWLVDYFSERLQFTAFNGRKSSLSLNCCGVLQGAVLSPFLFNMYTDSLRSSSPSVLIKYADDIALGNGMNSLPDQLRSKTELEAITTWSQNNDLFLNPVKCNCCIFTSIRNDNFPNAPVSINDKQLEVLSHVKYLGITFSSNLTWSFHIEDLYTKCLRLSYYIRRLNSIHIPHHVIRRFVDACVIPIILYASPVVFSGLLKKDYIVIKRSIKLIARASGIHYNDLCNIIIKRHFSACSNFSQHILNDPEHPLYGTLSNARSVRNTRRNFCFIFSRTEIYRRSPLPYLARILSNKDSEYNKLSSLLLQ
jgi:hypothetical protein